MFVSILLLLVRVYTYYSLSSALKVIAYNGQCVIWSDYNHGCTGYSEPFGLLNGESCSNITKLEDSTRKSYDLLTVEICGKQNGLSVAWVQINHTGLVKFMNRNGDQAECILNDGFKLGSSCSASRLASTHLSTKSSVLVAAKSSTTSSAHKPATSSGTSVTAKSPSSSTAMTLLTPLVTSACSFV